MGYKKIYIFVEGDIDRRFFEKIVCPFLKTNYDDTVFVAYSRMPDEKINQYIKSIISMGADYIFTTDIDMEECQITKTQKLCQHYSSLNEENTAIVVKEIESWYLAGLNSANCRKFKVKEFADTNLLTKEQFIRITPRRFESPLEFMLEILKCFSVQTAKSKNESFLHFSQKYGIESV